MRQKLVSLKALETLTLTALGLSRAEVLRQQEKFGSNEILGARSAAWLELLGETLKDPMLFFLLGVSLVFFLTGEKLDALILLFAFVPLTLMDVFLHWKTQASTASLKQNLASSARVIRDGIESLVSSEELVPGDLVIVREGEPIPADGVLERLTGSLQVDESVLTGEAFPIRKLPLGHTIDPSTGVGELSIATDSFLLAGTRVLGGEAQMRVLLTGAQTSYGNVIRAVQGLGHEKTPLQREIAKLVRKLLFGALLFCIILAVIRWTQGYGWVDGLLSAATLAVAAIPEEFPVVFTFFLGVGVYRLARKRAWGRRAVCVESIGQVSCICSDKTGTITRGELVLSHLQPGAESLERSLLESAFLASQGGGSDPVDLAIRTRYGNGERIPTVLRRFPFTEMRRQESTWTAEVSAPDAKGIAHLKGAPEQVLLRSHCTQDQRQRWLSETKRWAQAGHKVLACARRELSAQEIALGVEPESNYEFLGLLLFEDPPRPEVAAAVRYCAERGIRVIMITGDHPDTARAIASEVGIGGKNPHVISAEEHTALLQEDGLLRFPQALSDVDVVARCNPIQKLRIVQAFRRQGELVAVTGDGVNDVPALKAADIGIAMGERGTQSAREVASIILADDNFSTIVNAISEGRQLFANLRLSFQYLLLMHLPLVFTASVIPILGFPLVYLPIHIVWLELLIHPTAILAFQSVSDGEGLVARGSSHDSALVTRSEGMRILLLGLVVSVSMLLNYWLTLRGQGGIELARGQALGFLSLWSGLLVVILTGLKSRGSRGVAALTILASFGLMTLAGPWRELRAFFHFGPLGFPEWARVFTTLAIGAIAVYLGLVRRGPASK